MSASLICFIGNQQHARPITYVLSCQTFDSKLNLLDKEANPHRRPFNRYNQEFKVVEPNDSGTVQRGIQNGTREFQKASNKPPPSQYLNNRRRSKRVGRTKQPHRIVVPDLHFHSFTTILIGFDVTFYFVFYFFQMV